MAHHEGARLRSFWLRQGAAFLCLQTLKLVGGDFPDFDQLSRRIYTLLDGVALDNPMDMAQVGQQLKQQLNQIAYSSPQTYF